MACRCSRQNVLKVRGRTRTWAGAFTTWVSCLTMTGKFMPCMGMTKYTLSKSKRISAVMWRVATASSSRKGMPWERATISIKSMGNIISSVPTIRRWGACSAQGPTVRKARMRQRSSATARRWACNRGGGRKATAFGRTSRTRGTRWSSSHLRRIISVPSPCTKAVSWICPTAIGGASL